MIENLIPWMVVFPLVVGIALLFFSSHDTVRRYAIYGFTALIIGGSALFAAGPHPSTTLLDGYAHSISWGMLGIETLIACFIVWVTFRAKNWLALGCLLTQFLLCAG